MLERSETEFLALRGLLSQERGLRGIGEQRVGQQRAQFAHRAP